MNLVCISGEHYGVYSSNKELGVKHVLTVQSPEPLSKTFIEFMRVNPEKVRKGEYPAEEMEI